MVEGRCVCRQQVASPVIRNRSGTNNGVQTARQLVTDPLVEDVRGGVMAAHASFRARGLRTACERIVVFESTSQADLAATPDEAYAEDRLGMMTATSLGYCNTAEAFVAIEVRGGGRACELRALICLRRHARIGACQRWCGANALRCAERSAEGARILLVL